MVINCNAYKCIHNNGDALCLKTDNLSLAIVEYSKYGDQSKLRCNDFDEREDWND